MSTIAHRACRDIPTSAPPARHFSGTVGVERLSKRDGFDTETLRVSFSPGGRTGWHTHPVGQILIITGGSGIIATRTEARRMGCGDVVEIPAGIEHWHGATDTTSMQHIAIQPGGSTQWLELVSEADFADSVSRASA